MGRSPLKTKNSKQLPSQAFEFYVEDGKTYRPFRSPARLKAMDEKKNRGNKPVAHVQGIPDNLTGCWITNDKTQGQGEPVNSHNAVIQVSTGTLPLEPNSLITDSKSGDANPSYTRQSFQPISPGVKPSHCDSYGDTVPCGKPTSRRPSRTQDGNINPSAIGVGSVNTRASVSQKQPLSINTDVSFPLDTAFYTSNLSFEDTFPSDMSSDGTTSSASSSPPRGVIPTPESTVSNQFYLGVSDNFRGIAGISVWEGNPYDSPIGPLRLDEMCLPQGKMYGTLCGDSYTPPDTGLYDGITDFQNTQYMNSLWTTPQDHTLDGHNPGDMHLDAGIVPFLGPTINTTQALGYPETCAQSWNGLFEFNGQTYTQQ